MITKLREVRKRLGVTQEELSNKSGISRMTISKIESGVPVVVTTSTMIKLADALGVKVVDIFLI